MRYLTEASTIFRAIKESSIEKIAGNDTLDLAKYELGNIVWKQHTLLKTINADESEKLMDIITQLLDTMEMMNIKGTEKEILELARNLEITFYDAAYAYTARKHDIPLVTEDKALTKKIRTSEITVLTLKEIQQ